MRRASPELAAHGDERRIGLRDEPVQRDLPERRPASRLTAPPRPARAGVFRCVLYQSSAQIGLSCHMSTRAYVASLRVARSVASMRTCSGPQKMNTTPLIQPEDGRSEAQLSAELKDPRVQNRRG